MYSTRSDDKRISYGCIVVPVAFYDAFDWPPTAIELRSTGGSELISGGALDGTWRLLTTLDAEAPAGVYTLDAVGAYDRAANGGPLHAPELEARGWNYSFTKLP